MLESVEEILAGLRGRPALARPVSVRIHRGFWITGYGELLGKVWFCDAVAQHLKAPDCHKVELRMSDGSLVVVRPRK